MAREFSRLEEPKVPSGTLTYFFREALRRIWTSKRSSFVAISMIAMSLFILGTFMLIAENLEHAVAQWQGKSRINVYFETGATPQQIREAEQILASHGELARRNFVSKNQALDRFRAYFSNVSDLVGQIDENPFPASFEIEVTQTYLQSRAFDAHMNELRRSPGVEQVQFDWEWLAQLRRLARIINIVGLIAGVVLAIAAAFTIANVIRLTMLLYREEITIMRLVGATEGIIRGPFIVEGMLQGTIGGLAAAGLLYAAFTTAKQMIPPTGSLLWGFLFSTFLPWQKLAALVGGGFVAGWVGSWLSVRERDDL